MAKLAPASSAARPSSRTKHSSQARAQAALLALAWPLEVHSQLWVQGSVLMKGYLLVPPQVVLDKHPMVVDKHPVLMDRPRCLQELKAHLQGKVCFPKWGKRHYWNWLV